MKVAAQMWPITVVHLRRMKKSGVGERSGKKEKGVVRVELFLSLLLSKYQALKFESVTKN